MTSLVKSNQSRGTFFEFLAVELAPREGRWAAVARIAVACSITVAIAMTFQIPQPAYAAYQVFTMSKDEKGATLTTAIGGMLAVTLATIFTLGLCLVDTAEPAIRLPAMALVTFIAMYTARTFALGPVSYLAGFVLVLLQSIVDDVPTTEALTHTILWVWVIILVPVATTVLVQLLFGEGASAVAERGFCRILNELEIGLHHDDFRKSLKRWRASTTRMLELHAKPEDNATRPVVTPLVIGRLLDVLMIVETLPPGISEITRRHLTARLHACLNLLDAAIEREASQAVAMGMESAFTDGPTAWALLEALDRLYESLAKPATAAVSVAARAERRAFVPDAFSNPGYWQFALKTTIAVMTVYSIYTLLNWPGLRTSIVTCFFVALASLGETVHKLLLRLSGALIGGLIAGLCIVFVLPHLTDIGQLCLLVGAVAAGAAWIAVSSELLSYAGMQIAFAFLLGVLQGYAPATDLTVLRDRIVGILLGNIVITLVFSTLWPESAKARIRHGLADALKAIAMVLKGRTANEAARVQAVQALVQADHLQLLSTLELQMLSTHAPASAHVTRIDEIQRLASAAFVATNPAFLPRMNTPLLEEYARWSQTAADSVAKDGSMPRPPAKSPSNSTPALSPLEVNAREALDQLTSEIERVAAATR